MVSQPGELNLFLSGAWAGAVPLLSDAGTKITRGHDPYGGAWPRPTKIECRINNDSLNYDPSRPTSTLYGIAGQNTRARFRMSGSTQCWGEASSWAPDTDGTHVPGGNKGLAWVDFTAEGLLRRIGKWTDLVRSPMYRTNSTRANSLGHWSLEDGSGAAILSNSLGGGATLGTITGARLGDDDGPLGAGTVAELPTGGARVWGRFASASKTAGWQIAWAFKLPAIPAAPGRLLRWTTSAGYTWTLTVGTATYNLDVYDASGTLLHNQNILFGGPFGEPNNWVQMRVSAVPSGGNVAWDVSWYPQNGETSWGLSGTFAGTTGALRAWDANHDANLGDYKLSHVFGLTTVADNLFTTAAKKVFNGYIGELAGGRFGRVCAEQGIQAYFLGDAAQSIPMGPQKPATFLAILREIRDSEDARIDDERFDIALTMTTRRGMMNQTSALDLTYPSQVAFPFKKLIDDESTGNVITVSNAGGDEYQAVRTTGPKSTAPPPAGVGEYKRSLDVNVASPDLTRMRGDWELAKGTIERPRYEEVVVDLLANPGLATACTNVREGSMITVTGAEPEVLRFLVTGIVQSIGKTARTFTYQVELYDPWMIGIYDDPGTPASRWDSRTCTMASSAAAGVTALSLTTANRSDVWTTAGASFPFDLMIAGERVRATAMTAPAGTGPYTQTATVVRAQNGVAKTLPSGSVVSLADARRWGL